MSTSGGSGSAGLSVATAQLNSAAIATLFSAPTVIVAAPTAGQALVVVGGFTQYAATSGAWANTAGPNATRIFYGPTAPASGMDRAASSIFDDVIWGITSGDGGQTLSLAPTADDGSGPQLVTDLDGAPLIVSGDANPTRNDAIVTTTLAAAGTGYVIGDTGTIDDPVFGAVAAYVVDTVGALGVVLTYHLTSAGAGYDTLTNPHDTTAAGAQPGVGTGFQVNITVVAAPVADLYVTVFYRTVTIH